MSTTQDQFEATIPVVDMNDFYSTDRRQVFVTSLYNALSQLGFVGVINPGVDVTILDRAYASAREFFHQPMEQKSKCIESASSGQRGFVLSETAKGAKSKDLKEFFHIGMDYSAKVLEEHGYLANVWPEQPTGFRENMLALLSELNKYRVPIQQALSEALGCASDYFGRLTDQGDILLRALYYPANPQGGASSWAAAHTDIDLFTILPKATAYGLEVKNNKGEWIPVKVPDRAFIINAGDMLENISNGLIRSSPHRVLSQDPASERFSMVVFIHAKPKDSVSPLTQCIKKVGKRNFADACQADLLSERLADLGLASKERLADLANSRLMERLIELDRASPQAMRALAAANLASDNVLMALSQVSSSS